LLLDFSLPRVESVGSVQPTWSADPLSHWQWGCQVARWGEEAIRDRRERPGSQRTCEALRECPGALIVPRGSRLSGTNCRPVQAGVTFCLWEVGESQGVASWRRSMGLRRPDARRSGVGADAGARTFLSPISPRPAYSSVACVLEMTTRVGAGARTTCPVSSGPVMCGYAMSARRGGPCGGDAGGGPRRARGRRAWRGANRARGDVPVRWSGPRCRRTPRGVGAWREYRISAFG
jgi:hypothetical protein